jgi:hypothetical protein
MDLGIYEKKIMKWLLLLITCKLSILGMVSAHVTHKKNENENIESIRCFVFSLVQFTGGK